VWGWVMWCLPDLRVRGCVQVDRAGCSSSELLLVGTGQAVSGLVRSSRADLSAVLVCLLFAGGAGLRIKIDFVQGQDEVAFGVRGGLEGCL
jgi:hypothetical protein